MNQINILQKDNSDLMELIHDKNTDNSNNKNLKESDINDIIEQKESIIVELKKKINTLKNNHENEIKEYMKLFIGILNIHKQILF